MHLTLYSIIDKNTQKRFAGISFSGIPLFYNKGAFYQRIDTIRKHLWYLSCGGHIERSPGCWPMWVKGKRELSNLKQYDVEILEEISNRPPKIIGAYDLLK